MLIVQKFGGTSVGTLDRIKIVAKRVSNTIKQGHKVVIVVSAMSGETNKLIQYANYFSSKPNHIDIDTLLSSGERVTSSLLSIALNSIGHKSICMSGRKAGIITCSTHTKARIKRINPQTINSKLKEGYVIVVAGFQGINENGDVTTLGRGGSDLSAVAIASAIKADLCEVYTDVNGVYTADPSIESKARKIKQISYDEMLELASLGSKVLQSRSVEMAKKLCVKLICRSSFNEDEGTLITKEKDIMEKPLVSGIVIARNQARLSLIGVIDHTGVASDIFSVLANININVDMIVQTMGHNGKVDINFTVSKEDFTEAYDVLTPFIKNKKISEISTDDSITKISVVGVGMKSNAGVASKAFQAMANENIKIMMITTSEIKISMAIAEKYSELAVHSLHDAYELDK